MTSDARPIVELLMIDDSDMDRTICRRLCRKSGLDCVMTEAASATRGLELAGERPFDLIISDFILPGLRGDELVARIRSQGMNATTPIVLSSGLITEELRSGALGAGASAVIAKDEWSVEFFRNLLCQWVPDLVNPAA